MKNKDGRKFFIAYKNIPFSGFTQNGSQVLFNRGAYEFPKIMLASGMKRKLQAVIKSQEDVVGLTEIEFPLELEIKMRETAQ